MADLSQRDQSQNDSLSMPEDQRLTVKSEDGRITRNGAETASINSNNSGNRNHKNGTSSSTSSTRDYEERIRRLKAREAADYQAKLDQLMQSQLKADEARQRKNEERRRQIEENRKREIERRKQVEARRLQMDKSKLEKLDRLVEKAKKHREFSGTRSTETSLMSASCYGGWSRPNSARGSSAAPVSSSSVAFGSSIPRDAGTYNEHVARRRQKLLEERLSRFMSCRHKGCFAGSQDPEVHELLRAYEERTGARDATKKPTLNRPPRSRSAMAHFMVATKASIQRAVAPPPSDNVTTMARPKITPISADSRLIADTAASLARKRCNTPMSSSEPSSEIAPPSRPKTAPCEPRKPIQRLAKPPVAPEPVKSRVNSVDSLAKEDSGLAGSLSDHPSVGARQDEISLTQTSSRSEISENEKEASPVANSDHHHEHSKKMPVEVSVESFVSSSIKAAAEEEVEVSISTTPTEKSIEEDSLQENSAPKEIATEEMTPMLDRKAPAPVSITRSSESEDKTSPPQLPNTQTPVQKPPASTDAAGPKESTPMEAEKEVIPEIKPRPVERNQSLVNGPTSPEKLPEDVTTERKALAPVSTNGSTEDMSADRKQSAGVRLNVESSSAGEGGKLTGEAAALYKARLNEQRRIAREKMDQEQRLQKEREEEELRKKAELMAERMRRAQARAEEEAQKELERKRVEAEAQERARQEKLEAEEEDRRKRREKLLSIKRSVGLEGGKNSESPVPFQKVSVTDEQPIATLMTTSSIVTESSSTTGGGGGGGTAGDEPKFQSALLQRFLNQARLNNNPNLQAVNKENDELDLPLRNGHSKTDISLSESS